jgi:DNA-binding CsgD family transcriptional regulator
LIKLSPRELEVLVLYAENGRIKSVAESLATSPNTVRGQKYSIMRKLGATNAVELIRSAIKRGLVKI